MNCAVKDNLCINCKKEVKLKKVRKTNDKKKYRCMRCVGGELFATKKELNEHIKSCCADFVCPLCNNNIHVLNTIYMLKGHFDTCVLSYNGCYDQGSNLFNASLCSYIDII